MGTAHRRRCRRGLRCSAQKPKPKSMVGKYFLLGASFTRDAAVFAQPDGPEPFPNPSKPIGKLGQALPDAYSTYSYPRQYAAHFRARRSGDDRSRAGGAGQGGVGQEVEVVGLRPEALKQVVGRIGNGALRQRVDEGWPGDTVGIFLKGAQKEDVKRGMVLATLGSIAAHTRFTPEIHTGTEQEGGRDVPLLAPRTLQFTFRGLDVTGLVKPPSGDRNGYAREQCCRGG